LAIRTEPASALATARARGGSMRTAGFERIRPLDDLQEQRHVKKTPIRIMFCATQSSRVRSASIGMLNQRRSERIAAAPSTRLSQTGEGPKPHGAGRATNGSG